MTLLMQEYRSSHSLSLVVVGGGGGGGTGPPWIWPCGWWIREGCNRKGEGRENKDAGIRLRREMGVGGGGGDNCLHIRPVYKGGVLLLRDAWPVQARSQWGFEGFSRTPNFCR